MVDVVTPSRASYVEWGAVFAGALAASAISFVLLTAGASVGLSLISPYASQSYPRTAATIAVFWSLAVPILALLAGGYIAGRMRAAWAEVAAPEARFRDGIHGLLVWSLSVVVGGMLAFLAAGTVMQTSAQVAASSSGDRGAVVTPAVDILFAPTGAAAPSGTSAEQSRATGDAETRGLASRTLVSASTGGQLDAARKQTLVRLVAERTGLPQAEAEKRVDQAFADAKAALEKSRQAAVLAGLVTVTALLTGLLASWYAAQRGGDHRDNQVPPRLTWSVRPINRVR